MEYGQKYLSRLAIMVPFAAFLGSASPASAQATEDFAVLGGPKVTCTDSAVAGDVGSAFPGSKVIQTDCTIDGTVHAGDGVAKKAYEAFLAEYDRLEAISCDEVFTVTTLDSPTFSPGVYCFEAALTLTGVVTLEGSSTDTWIFKIGTLGTGALTGTNFDVVMTGDGEPCNVTWWVAEAATITDSDEGVSHFFVGTILAGAAITTTGTVTLNATGRVTFTGDAFAKAAVTMTDTNLFGCEATGGGGNGHGKCNQGVGNGTEECDPGNSNQGDDSRSNDEEGGTPGDPGRKGGNGK